jgi:hypothetical protein
MDASHRFLRLTQPIPSSSYPVPRVAEAGRTYKFPFTFVVPQQLVEQICNHQRESDQVHEEHLQLPPSLGDPSLASDGAALLDDMAPDMARISYAIKVRVVRSRESDGKLTTVAEKARKVRIIPASEEHPPLNAEDGNREGYVLRREKDLRKGVFKGKLGRLTIETAQPRSLRLPPPRSGANPQVTTMATVKLRFDPADENTTPPKLGTLVNKLKVHTFFSAKPMNTLPSKEDAFYTFNRAVYSTSVQLSSRCIESVRWERRREGEDEEDRRDSCFSALTGTTSGSSNSNQSRRSSAASKHGVFHTAEILVPITLPKCKAFPPTFHSCLVSRVYVLDLTLSAQAPGGASISACSLSLKVPIQISAASNASRNSQETETYEVEEFFNPRSVAPPAADLTGTSPSIMQGQPQRREEGEGQSGTTAQQLPSFMMASAGAAGAQPPPGYSFFAGASQGVPIRIPSPVGSSPGCG